MFNSQLLEDGTLRVARTQEADLPALLHQLTAVDETEALAEPLRQAYAQLRGEMLALLPVLEGGDDPAEASPSLVVSPELAALVPKESLTDRQALNSLLDVRLDSLEARLRAEIRGFDTDLAEHANRVLAFTFEGGKGFLTLRAYQQWRETRRRIQLAPDDVKASVEALGLTTTWERLGLLNDHYADLCGFTTPVDLPPEDDTAYPDALNSAQEAIARLVCLANLTTPEERARLLHHWLNLQSEYQAQRRRA